MNATTKARIGSRRWLALWFAQAGRSLADAGGPQPASSPTGLDRAMAHCERCEWARAFDELALQADAGHPEAARIALLMRAHGPRLFGHTFAVGEARRQRWLALATRSAEVDS